MARPGGSPGLGELERQHLYRTAGGFLAPMRANLEVAVFAQDRALLTQTLGLVFVDTTSVFLWGDTETPLRWRRHSRDRRPDQSQVLLCVAVGREGWPVAWDILPGNTADQTAFRALIARLRTRFRIGRVLVVADREKIPAGTIALLTEHRTAPFDFILGCKLRRDQELATDVLGRPGRFQPVAPNLVVKEVRVGDHHYVVCRNPEEALRDTTTRDAILAHLETTLRTQGLKAVIGNTGFARFLTIQRKSVPINSAAIEAGARLDGEFVLRTNIDLPAAGERPPAIVTSFGPVGLPGVKPAM